MTKSQIYTAIAAILTTLAEVPEGWGPNGHLYMAFHSQNPEVFTLSAYYSVIAMMKGEGWIEVSDNNEIVTITTSGRALAERFEKALAEAKAARTIGG